MKKNEIRQKSSDELKSILIDFKKEAFNLRFQAASGSISKTDRRRYVRKSVARIKTILNERTLKLEVGNA
jgi:large subunit ribosomal protein L29